MHKCSKGKKAEIQRKQMDYVEDESGPRFLPLSSAKICPSNFATRRVGKMHLILCSTSSLLLLALSFLPSLPGDSAARFLLLWMALSLFVGPFAPLSLTGGDVAVGQGETLPEEVDNDAMQPEEVVNPRKRSVRQRKPSIDPPFAPSLSLSTSIEPDSSKIDEKQQSEDKEDKPEMEWTMEDFELLKKLVARNPVGVPGRWELIAEPFRGRHHLENVIAAAKSLAMVKPGPDGDSFAVFLRQRKKEEGNKVENSNMSWSNAEDVALLNALKAFPKDTPMRWEKIAESVPGKSKASCMKRFNELKRNYRSSKESS
ncbi:transcription factor MAMYB isoform X1 [Nymphaea colorata]|nr:transcription factor MAMYB isoform X1 [Nymphaea colorata]